MIQTYTNTAIDTTPSVRSKDGATISYLSMGCGFTVHIIERRGRGRSSPQGDDYSMDKEREDVLALQQQTGAAFLVGHSFGGLVALEAARNHRALTKIAVYEPGVSIDRSIPMDWMPGYEQKLAARQYYDALVEFSLGTGPDRARNTPQWLMKLLLPLFLSARERQQMLGLLPENLREHRELARLDSSYENYREIAANVLLMCGGKSHSTWVDQAIAQLAAVLPHAETKAFPSLNHFGIDKRAPREVAKAVSDYFMK